MPINGPPPPPPGDENLTQIDCKPHKLAVLLANAKGDCCKRLDELTEDYMEESALHRKRIKQNVALKEKLDAVRELRTYGGLLTTHVDQGIVQERGDWIRAKELQQALKGEGK